MCTYKSAFLLTISLDKMKISDIKEFKEFTDSFTDLTIDSFVDISKLKATQKVLILMYALESLKLCLSLNNSCG